MGYFQEGAVALRILPCTVETGTTTITGFGTKQDFLALVDPSFEVFNPEKVEYNELRISGGVTMRSQKINKVRDASTGEAVGSEGDGFDCTVVCSYTDLKWLMSLLHADPQVPLAIAFAPLIDDGGAAPGWMHLMCKVNGNIKYSGKDGVATIPLSFKGSSFSLTTSTPPTYTSYNTAMTGSGNTITPFGTTTALEIAALTAAADLTSLLSGKIVCVDAA